MSPKVHAPSRRGLARRWAALVVASLLAGGVTTLSLPVLTASADGPISYTISVSPEGPYTDGQAVTIRVAGPRGLHVTNSGFCHPDMPVATTQDHLTEWCTSTVGNGITGGTEPADPNGVIKLTVRAGVGTAEKVAPALGTSHEWKCDATSPCKVALEITPETGSGVFDTSVELTYRENDATAGCGGPTDDQIATAAPDRLTEAWVAWTVGECAGKGTATGASFTNDGASLAQFASGSVDLAYSGVPVDTAGFGEATRPAVQTPVALNATVLAVAGFHPTESSIEGTKLWRPIDDVEMSTAELNALLSGHLTLDEGLQDSLRARNPQLAKQGTAVSFAMPNTLAGPQATTDDMSHLLEERMGAAWSYPNLASKYEDHAGDALGAFADYNTVFNSLAMINLYSGKPQLVGDIYKKLSEKPQANSLVHFYLTDLATARQLHIAPVAIQDESGEYVLPTPETLTSGAYPLTFVEYAVTPKDRIVTEDCTPDEDATTSVRDWVGYLVGDGQADLAEAGLVPLPAALGEDAEASLATIASAEPTTGPCAPTDPDPDPETPPPTDPGTLPPGNVPSLPSSNVPSSGNIPGIDDPSGNSGPSSDTPGDADDATDAEEEAAQASIEDAQSVVASTEIPRLRGPLGAGVLVATLTMVGLVGLTSLTGWLSGGRRRARATPA